MCSLGWAGLALRKMGQRVLHTTVPYKVHIYTVYTHIYIYISVIVYAHDKFVRACVCVCPRVGECMYPRVKNQS